MSKLLRKLTRVRDRQLCAYCTPVQAKQIHEELGIKVLQSDLDAIAVGNMRATFRYFNVPRSVAEKYPKHTGYL